MADARQSLYAHFALSDLGTISASQEALSAQNLIDESPRTTWRSTGTSAVTIDVQLDANILAELVAASLGYNLFGLGYVNMNSSGSWEVRTATSQANLTSSPSYTQSSIAAWKNSTANMRGWQHTRPWVHTWHTLPLDTYRTEAWVRFSLTDATPIGGVSYLEAARVIVAYAVRPTFHQAPGGSRSIATDLAGARREEVRIEHVDDADVDLAWFDLRARCGARASAVTQTSAITGAKVVGPGAAQVWYQYDPDDDRALQRTIVGYFDRPLPATNQAPGINSFSASIVEAL